MQHQLFPYPDGQWSVPCPQCGAGSGEPCHSTTGTIYPKYTHNARQKVLAMQPPKNDDITWVIVLHDPLMVDSVPVQVDLTAAKMILTKYGTVYES